MVSKNQIKLITSLVQKKYRKQEKLFIAEGAKVIDELLQSNIQLQHLYITKPMFANVSNDLKTLVTDLELKKISALTTPNDCLALFYIPEAIQITDNSLTLVLDSIQDPGNLGTIIRLCDWYGISQIICSDTTVDVYNPKVVQATMGSIARVSVHYTCLKTYLSHAKMPVFGTFMEGQNIYQSQLPKQAIIVLGNEGNGIGAEIQQYITQKITIPRFGSLQRTESLNVAIAAAIVLSEFKRNG